MNAGRAEVMQGFFSSPRLTSALTTAAIGLAVATFPVERLIGRAGLAAAVATTLALMTANFVARRRDLEWRGLPPISLLAFLLWAAISLVWSEYQWATVGGLVSLAAVTALGLFIAVSRDTIQIIRSMGDALRVALGASLALEVFSGIIIDAPIRVLAIEGKIAELGPISGLAANRNQLGLLAVIGMITFVIEMRTKSIRRLTGVLSLVAAAICILLTQSSVVMFTAALVGIAAALVYGIRRVRADRRQYWQFTVLGLSIVGIVAGWLFRGRLVEIFNASGQLDYRLGLWDQIQAVLPLNGLEGWGWVGRWHVDLPPYSGLQTPGDRQAMSALNTYLDVWLQIGLVGLVIFIGMVALAFARSWLLAGRRRSVVYAWPAAVLVALITIAMAESSLLFDIGWLTFVVCCVKASQGLSWRSALRPAEPETEPVES